MFPFTAVSVSSFEALVGKRTRASRTGTLRLLVRAKDSEGRGELASSFVSLVVTLTCYTCVYCGTVAPVLYRLPLYTV